MQGCIFLSTAWSDITLLYLHMVRKVDLDMNAKIGTGTD